MKNMRRKLKNRAGFTMAEMLLAVLILLLVSGLMATGIPAAKNAYEKVVLASNAEVLLSTTINELRNELGTARDVQVSGTTITYVNSYTSSKSKICLYTGGTATSDTPNGTIMLQRFVSDGGLGTDSNLNRLTSKAASTGLYATYGSVTYTNGIVSFTELEIKRKSSEDALASLGSLSIRVISAY